MNRKSIYKNQCPQLKQLFAQAGSLDRVMVVALDFARDIHMALICNGLGEQLLKPFPVHNNRPGIQYLNERIRTTCKRYRIDPAHVFLGGEDDPSYARNFLWAIHGDWLVLRVNAFLAKKQRENLQASTDKLDLLGIAKMLLNRQATRVFHEDHSNDPSQALKNLGRERDALLRNQTRLGNRIHGHVKILFPGFLTEGKGNPVEPFSDASLALMQKDDFNAASYARKQNAPLARMLQKSRLRNCDEKADTLITRARDALPPPPHLIAVHRQSMQILIPLYRALQRAASELQYQQALHLATSPAALLTSLPGIGIIPSTTQSGGPDAPAITKRVRPRCNHRLKNHLVRTATRIGELLGPDEIRRHYRRLAEAGQHAAFIHSRKLLGMIKTLQLKGTIWLPAHLLEGTHDDDNHGQQYRQQMYEHLLEHWPKICAKWNTCKALTEALKPEHPLGQWRLTIQELYQIELPPNKLPILAEEVSSH